MFLPFFFFTAPPTTEIYTLSLHDALPIFGVDEQHVFHCSCSFISWFKYTRRWRLTKPDRKSTRLNSSHRCISYAVFCLKKKKTETILSEPSQGSINNLLNCRLFLDL